MGNRRCASCDRKGKEEKSCGFTGGQSACYNQGDVEFVLGAQFVFLVKIEAAVMLVYPFRLLN